MKSAPRSVIRLIRRAIAAKKLGFHFSGTSRFVTPTHIKLLRKHLKLSTPPEPGIAKDVINVLLDDEYRISKLKPYPKTVIDIGANVGLFSLWAAAHFPSATIHAYEPNQDLWEYTEANLSQVGARLFREGVGLSAGRGSVNYMDESRLGKCELSEGGGVVVAAFGDVVERIGGRVDLLKMDCEGAEWQMLEDTETFFAVDRVVMEYHELTAKHTLESLIRRFKELGFVANHVAPNRGFGIACFSRRDS